MKNISTLLISFPAPESALAEIKRNLPDCEIRVVPSLTQPGQTLPRSVLRGVEAALIEFPPANFDDFDRLRWMQLASVGFEQVEKLPLAERGIRVSNARGVLDSPIAEWNILMMLLWHRRLPEMMENQRRAIWDPSAKFQDELRGSTIGFYGYGGIARETARLAKAMGVTVWALTRDGAVKSRPDIYRVDGTGDADGVLPERSFAHSDRKAFLSALDYLFVTMPLTPATRGLIGDSDLRSLKSSAVLINPARAAIVDEAALLRSLRERWIRGAAFDVHYAYPLPPGHPLWSMPEIVLTPHISGSSGTPAYPRRVFDVLTQNLIRLGDGRTLLNEVTPRDVRGA